MRSYFVCSGVLCGSLAAGAHAHLFHYVFGMNGHSVVAPTDSSARGTGHLIYNHHTFNYDLDLRITGVGLDDLLDAGPNGTPLHIYHGSRGQNGDIVLDPGYFGDFVQDGDAIRLTLSLRRIGGQQGAFSSNLFENQNWMYNGDLYIQLFTQQYPDGEIRGQLPPFGKHLAPGEMGEFSGLQGPPTPVNIPAPAGALALVLCGVVSRRRR
ncbi:MAG: CHRD domain-containing protein [Phycisphaerales bacterium]|nr:CHRD domain-containing protein [Phycisphaerales bacterium]